MVMSGSNSLTSPHFSNSNERFQASLGQGRPRPAGMATSDARMNEYEAERERRIAANKERMRALGLGAGSHAFDSALAPMDPNAPTLEGSSNKRPRKRYERAAAAQLNGGSAGQRSAPARESRRLRGYRADLREIAPGPGDKARPIDDTTDGQIQPHLQPSNAVERDGAKRRGIAFPDPRDDPNSTVSAPFTLASLRVSVLDLGAIHRGPFPQNYWSSRGCIYHHPFPVGYRARKTHFGREWEMRIDAGECGPSFVVTDVATGELHAGDSPTQPWTKVCVKKGLGTRISGPQFFGFSDPVTMRALSTLCSPSELRRCLTKGEDDGDGCRLGCGDGTGTDADSDAGMTDSNVRDDPTPLELAVKEFQQLDGIGEKTAIALATTVAFSHLIELNGTSPSYEGRRLAGLAELVACVGEGGQKQGEGEAFVKWWLTASPELPAATTRWPAWSARIVPKVMDQLAGRVEIGAGRNERRRSGRGHGEF